MVSVSLPSLCENLSPSQFGPNLRYICREYIASGSKYHRKLCQICKTEKDGKRIEKHVEYCLKYYQFVQMDDDDENSRKCFCKLCEKKFDHVGSLYNHIETNHDDEVNPLRKHIGPGSKYHRRLCRICNFERERKSIEKHVEYCLKYYQFVQTHDEDPQKISCKFCQKLFDQIGSLYKHIRTNHDGDGISKNKKRKKISALKERKSKSARHSYDLFKNTTSVNNQLTNVNKQLMKKEEEEEVKTELKQKISSTTFECEICQLTFQSIFALNGHMQKHNDKEAKNPTDENNISKPARGEKENSQKNQSSSSKYSIPISIELIPIPMKNEENFQDQDYVNKQLTKRMKQSATINQINVVESSGKKLLFSVRAE